MAQIVQFSGQDYSIPFPGDRRWAQQLTNYFIALADPTKLIQKDTSLFELEQDLNFGTAFGLVAKYLKSTSSNIAQSGVVRLARADLIAFRNTANDGDLTIGFNSSDQLVVNGSTLPQGTVTSVAATGSTGLSVGGSPITSSGTLTFTLSAALQALSSFNSNGLMVQTAANTFTSRSITGTASRITLTNGNGVSGNPTVDIASDYVGQASITTLGTIGTGVWNGTTIALANGGTGRTSYNGGDMIYAGPGGTNLFTLGIGTHGYVMTVSGGAPVWQAPAALTRVDDTNVTLTLGGTPATSLLQAVSITAGWTGTLSGARGGTGVANSGKTITLGGNLTTSGANDVTFTTSGSTGVTLPTSGTLATTAQLPTGANPTSSVGLSAVNGSALTFMRSDGAPALSQSITPTWTGAHIHSNTVSITSAGNSLFVKGTGAVTTAVVNIQLDDNSGAAAALKIANLTNWAQSGAFATITAANAGDTGALISLVNAGSGNYLTCDSNASITKGGLGTFKNLALSAPITKTADWTVGANEYAFISNRAATNTVTLPTASTNTGRIIRIKTITAQTVVSASSNVAPLTSATPGTAILAATAGKWAELQSDGTNWIIMAGN